MEILSDFDDAMARAQLSYWRLRQREAKQGISWPIIPDRRWGASEEAGVVIVTGYAHSFPHSDPVIRYRVTPSRAFRIKC